MSYLYRHSTSASTARTHSTAEKQWLAVTAKIGTDPRMPDEWHHRTDKLRTTTITWEVGCIVARAMHNQHLLIRGPQVPGKRRRRHPVNEQITVYAKHKTGPRPILPRVFEPNHRRPGKTTSNRQNDPKLLRSARSQSNHCPTRSLHRHVDWRHGRGPRIGIPTNPCAHHEPRSV